MRELSKIYDPKEVEKKIYEMWIRGNYFHAEKDPEKTPYTIVIPPPNVTGQLHLGHAFDETIQDVLIRYKRMQGYAALWMPGCDHAGIATQIKVEEKLREEGLSRFDLGRDKFIERVWEWKNLYGSRITEQLKTLGSSCDWERERFTMDEGCSAAVRETFVSLYERGLIYKGSRIINWCPECTTALSDTEVEHEDAAGHLWYVRYRVAGSDEFVAVATTRPETMLGDTGVAVNPNDDRYAHLVGKTAVLPLMEREIPIIADEYVDMEFGTGCVKMTPCHDPNDFEVGKRHGLEEILVLDGNARINENGGKYCGMERYEARAAVLADLEAGGYLVKVEDHAHNVGICYRCGTTIEPMTSDQWFVKMAPLAEKAIEIVKDGTIKFVPERFTKTYLNWMENVHDWCISRQLWWGHQIPAWYCADCGHVTVSREDPNCCEKCSSANITREEDVLDTWFSSALWPFSTLGWPEDTEDLDYFFPTDVLVTGYDIIFFWVARMIIAGIAQMDSRPFHTVLIHGLIRDPEGKKMSKSAGNGVDPIEIIDQYGADALRFNLSTGNSPGNDMRFYMERIEAMRNFANKLWNASRFVLMNLTVEKNELPEELELADKWIISKMNTLASEVCDNLDRYELGIAADKIYDFIWDSYCDWYIELTKPRLLGDDENSKLAAEKVLLYVLTETLTLLHPFMPYITEEIWQALPHDGEALMIRNFTKYEEALDFSEDEAEFERVLEAIKAVRSLRAEMKVPPAKRPKLTIVTDRVGIFRDSQAYIMRLAYAGELEVTMEFTGSMSGMASAVTNDARVLMPLSELVDVAKERERIERELEKAKTDYDKQMAKLSNEAFVSKAPERVIQTERERAEKARALIENLMESYKTLEEL